MSFDQRFYGVYEGIVVNNNDPENRGRVTLQVPQVTGSAETNWCPSLSGNINQTHFPYLTAVSTVSQTVSAANTATIVNFSAIEDDNKIKLVDGTKLTVEESGDYFLQFSAQFAKPGSNSAQADIWVLKNGNPVPRSNSRVTMAGNPNEVLAAVAFVIDLDAGDYVQFAFSSADNSVALTCHSSLTSPTRPNIPGIIATLNLIGKYRPIAGTKVGVMYLAGDPNFPLWIGEIA